VRPGLLPHSAAGLAQVDTAQERSGVARDDCWAVQLNQHKGAKDETPFIEFSWTNC